MRWIYRASCCIYLDSALESWQSDMRYLHFPQNLVIHLPQLDAVEEC